MVHQAKKEGQVVGIHAFLVKGKNVGSRACVQQIVGVFDPVCDPFERKHGTNVVEGDERFQRLVVNFGVNSHTIKSPPALSPSAHGAI